MVFKEEILKRVELNGGWKNNHCHLDRAYTINNENLSRSQISLQEKWAMLRELKTNSTVDGILYRMMKAIDIQANQGVTYINTFLDFDKYSLDKPYKAFELAKEKTYEKYGNIIELECTNQTIEGVIESESRDWFHKGAELCDNIGGLPGRDKDNIDLHLTTIFNEAERYNKGLHIHVDQFSNPNENETELVLDKIDEHNFKNMVSLIHCISLNCHDKEYRESIYKRIKSTNTNIICCPRIWLDRERSETLAPIHNPITAVNEMLNHDINIGIGTDNISDIISAFSDADMYQELVILAMCNRLYDIDKLVKIVTTKLW
ncbi:MAG: amidohydrolase family protein [Mycoplasmataceae bacterium]|nr:amidohydrolase family protein [Mycoplasmataceae bacterium]